MLNPRIEWSQFIESPRGNKAFMRNDSQRKRGFRHLVFYTQLIPYVRPLLALLKTSDDFLSHALGLATAYTFYHICTGKLANTKYSGVIQFAFNGVPANASRKGRGACGIMEELEYYQGQRANLGKRVGRWKFRSGLARYTPRARIIPRVIVIPQESCGETLG